MIYRLTMEQDGEGINFDFNSHEVRKDFAEKAMAAYAIGTNYKGNMNEFQMSMSQFDAEEKKRAEGGNPEPAHEVNQL